jgi:chromosome segregation ATPase
MLLKLLKNLGDATANLHVKDKALNSKEDELKKAKKAFKTLITHSDTLSNDLQVARNLNEGQQRIIDQLREDLNCATGLQKSLVERCSHLETENNELQSSPSNRYTLSENLATEMNLTLSGAGSLGQEIER